MPVSTSSEGQSPEISFGPRYLAEALAIGPVLRLIYGISSGLPTGPSGSYWVIMPCRLAGEAEVKAEEAGETAGPAPAIGA